MSFSARSIQQQVVQDLLLKHLRGFLSERCALMGYVPNAIPANTFASNASEQIKIAGDFTLFRETAVWKDLNDASTPKQLHLSQAELELVLFRLLKEVFSNQPSQIPVKKYQDHRKDLLALDQPISTLAQKLLDLS